MYLCCFVFCNSRVILQIHIFLSEIAERKTEFMHSMTVILMGKCHKNYKLKSSP